MAGLHHPFQPCSLYDARATAPKGQTTGLIHFQLYISFRDAFSHVAAKQTQQATALFFVEIEGVKVTK